MTKNLDEARKFLDTIFHAYEPDDDGKLLIWTLPDRAAYFCDSTEKAVHTVAKANGSDIYVGVGISKKALPRDKRGDLSNIKALPALVLDLDVTGPGKKKPAFKSKEEALKFAHSLPLPPTVIVDSGGGLHCWNVFNDPLEIESDDDLNEAMRLSVSWHRLAQREAAKLGVTLDSVYDLTRVLRVPGTHNYKYGKPGRPVKILELNDTKLYNPDDYELYLLDAAEIDNLTIAGGGNKINGKSLNIIEGLVLSPDRQPPAEKLAALLCNSKEFRETWERTRTDMTDTSASAWDMALANIAAQAEWTEQEIADLLIANRVKHSEKLKIRETYINRTIAKATSQVRSEKKAMASISSILSVIEGKKALPWMPAKIEEGTEDYVNSLRVIRHTTGLPLVKLVKYGRSLTSTYSATFINPDKLTSEGRGAEDLIDEYTSTGVAIEDLASDAFVTQTFPDVESFEDQRTWANIASTVFCTDPVLLKKEVWRKVVKIMRHTLCEVLSEDFTEKNVTMSWVQQFIGSKEPPSFEEVVDTRMPFTRNIEGVTYLHIKLKELGMFLRQTRVVNISQQALGTKLSTAGFEPKHLKIINSTERFWRIPMKDFKPAPIDEKATGGPDQKPQSTGND